MATPIPDELSESEVNELRAKILSGVYEVADVQKAIAVLRSRRKFSQTSAASSPSAVKKKATSAKAEQSAAAKAEAADFLNSLL